MVTLSEEEIKCAYDTDNAATFAHLYSDSGKLDRLVRHDVAAPILEKVLLSHGIDTKLYGSELAKSIQQLADELARGDCALVEEIHNSEAILIRLVRPVFIKLKYSGCVLVNTCDVYPERDGENGKPYEKGKQSLIAEKMQSSDLGVLDVAFRGLEEELGLEREKLQRLLKDGWRKLTQDVSECAKLSPSYPGLRTVYLRHLVTLEFKPETEGELKEQGLPECVPFTSYELSSGGPVIHHWSWVEEGEALAAQVVGICPLDAHDKESNH